MQTVQNPFVAYLNRYTTASPDHEAAFDEFIASALPPGVAGLRLSTKIEQFLREVFQRAQPPSIILTGNAGDGKTYLCRQVLSVVCPDQPYDWEKLIDRPIEHGTMRLFIIKDLSELSEEKGKEILARLDTVLQDPTSRDRYLIAANEGRLRQLIADFPSQSPIVEKINIQLDKGADIADESLIVINLNRVATSVFVPEALNWMTDRKHWRICEQCPACAHCPIRYNADQLRQTLPAERVQLLYQLLEATGEHVTIRDMLIHLAYTIVGGLQCATVQREDQRYDWSRFVYYENIFGRDDEGFRRKSHLTQLLGRLQVGQYSSFAIDEFILSGGNHAAQQSEHAQLFGETIDLHGKRFQQNRRAYLKGEDSEQAHRALEWLPHCRRKLFFVRSGKDHYQLLPFRFLELYQQSLDQPTEETRRNFVKGLNRAFSRLYLNEEHYLYVTSQYIYSVRQPHPLVLLKIPIDHIWLISEKPSNDYLDTDNATLVLDIAPPPRLQANPVKWNVGLLQFEYIMRLARGGHFSVLANECELDIRRLKDELIRQFAFQQSKQDTVQQSKQDTVEFFVPAQRKYEVRKLQITEQGTIAIE